MTDESVHVSEYAPDWPARFAEQQVSVSAVLAPPVVPASAARGLHPDNRNAYTSAKNEFVASMLRHAGIDPPARGRLPE